MGDSDNCASEARWRNYQHLIWTQQQIQLQIQHQQQHHHQQQMQTPKMNGMEMENGNGGGGMNNHGLQPIPLPEKSLEDKPKEGMDPWDNFDAQAAFLGPTLWDKRLPYDGQDFKLEYVDLEEFLTENGIPVEAAHHGEHYIKNVHGHIPPNNNGNILSNGPTSNGNSAGGMSSEQASNSDCSPPGAGGGGSGHSPHGSIIGPYGPGPSRNPQQGLIDNSPNQQNLLRGPSSINQSETSRSPSPCGSSISRSSDDSSSSIQNHHNHLEDSHEHGRNFDPRTRIFTEDELKPQPMMKKSKKQFVPDEQKDAKYWARRRKNNMAAKRSRDARRVKENQIAMRACFLEKENSILKQEIDRIQKENMLLKEQLNCCRREH